MRDIFVTDAQRALRRHAEAGHDVTQRPDEVYIDGKPYRMRES